MLQQLMLMGVPERFLLEEEGLYGDGGAGGGLDGWAHGGEGSEAAAARAAARVVARYQGEKSRDPLLGAAGVEMDPAKARPSSPLPVHLTLRHFGLDS